jgi:hypothetical protein
MALGNLPNTVRRVVNSSRLPIRPQQRETTKSRECLGYGATTNDSGRMVGNPEVILGHDLFGGQVVIALLYCAGLSETNPQPDLQGLILFRSVGASGGRFLSS